MLVGRSEAGKTTLTQALMGKDIKYEKTQYTTTTHEIDIPDTKNVFLKGTEGAAKFMGNLVSNAFKKNIFTKIGYLFARSGIKEMKAKMDYKSYGGAMLLGVNKLL